MFVTAIADGIRGVVSAGPMCALAVRKRFWLETRGKIVGVDVRQVEDPERRRVLNYVLLYEYRVDGVQYFGVDRIPMDVPYYATDDVLKDLCARFPAGEVIQIFYPEHDPATSSARRDVVGLAKALMMVGVGAIAAIGFYVYIRGVSTS
jgi:hypothetical protein